MSKRALVISGGGSKGAFAVGVIDYLVRTCKLKFDLVAGTSTGGIIAPLVVTNDVQDLVDIYSNMRTKDVMAAKRATRALKSTSLYSVGPGKSMITRWITPDRSAEILGSEIQMFITGVPLQTRRLTYFQTGPPGKKPADSDLVPIIDRSMLIQALLATSAVPGVLPVARVPAGVREPHRQFVDGGVREIAPLDVAITNGATEVYAILLRPAAPKPEAAAYRSLVNVLGRTLEILTDEIMYNDVRHAERYNDILTYVERIKVKVKRKFEDKGCSIDDGELKQLFRSSENPLSGRKVVRLVTIQPASKLEAKAMEFVPEQMQKMVRQGRARAKLKVSC